MAIPNVSPPIVPEDKLADSAPKQPLALTIGAAAVTLLVIVGVLAGPSMYSCFNSDGGMGMCLRGKMADAGILPQPAVAIAEPTAAPEVGGQLPAEPDVAVAEPELDVTPPAGTTPAPDTLIAATFGLLRAEPDGSVVIAGSGTPGSEVEVYSNDELLGRAKVEPSGDWVLVPDAPIPPGGTELTLAEAGKPGRAAESFVVVVNDDKSSEPLVVASTPGAASDILQGLKRPAAGATTEVAAADTPRTQPATEAPAAPQAIAAPPAVPAPLPRAETQPSSEPAPEASPSAPAPAAEPATAPAAPPPANTPPPADVAPAPEVAASATPAIDTAAATPEATAPAVEAPPAAETPTNQAQETTVAAADPVVPPPASSDAALPNVPPTIDAIEIEGDKSFFAGGGPDGAVIRLYVDGKYIADATVADGRWLVETGKVLTKSSQRIRIDLLKPGTADVAARAEVDFQVELPADQPTAVAEAEPAKPSVPDEPAASATPEAAPADAPAELAAPAEPPAAEDKSASGDVAATVAPPGAAVDKSAETESSANPAQVAAAKPGQLPADAIDNAPKPETAAVAAATTTGAPTAPEADQPPEVAQTNPATPASPDVAAAPAAPVAEPAAGANVAAPAEISQPAEPAVEPSPAPSAPAAAATPEVATDEPVTEEDVPTMVAVAVGDPELARFASGKAIIRRGDNLWTIARRVYGAGIKYTTIYEANNGQIRNPNRIYPGQVFDLPTN